jgi:pentatricopeptide repeat protein
MSFFCNSFPSTSGSLLSKVASRQLLPFLYPLGCFRASNAEHRRTISRRSSRVIPTSAVELEAWFFNAISNAGHCRGQCSAYPLHTPFFTSRRPLARFKGQVTRSPVFQRQEYTSDSQQNLLDDVEPEIEPEPEPNRTKEELLALVDQYGGESYTDQLPLLELPQLYQPSDGPFLTVSEKPEDEWPPPYYAWPADEETKIQINALKEALKDFYNTPELIFELYRALPEPRVPYLDSKTRHKMLRHLSVVERKDETSMLRYMSVIDDVKEAAIPLSITEWNSALSFVSRYVAKSTEVEVEAALTMWREMEHKAGVKSDDATFNILFDVSCKAGRFTLAEMIYKEMERRGFPYDRYHHTSLIFYYGLKQSGDGARAAYKALVEAGEIVDTVVLNAMISALLRSSEAEAAENVYERMKKAHFERPDSRLPPPHYKDRRTIAQSLKKMARKAKYNKSKIQEAQQNSIIAPDLHTFRILVNYSAVQAGELDRTAKFLEEMSWFGLPLHGALFLSVFKGFAIHGGVRYTHWTDQRLESVWASLLEGLNANVEGLYISRWLVTWLLRAFAKCSGKSRTMAVWEEIRSKWEPDEADLDFVMSNLQAILDSPDMAIRRHDWMLGSL